MSANITYKFIIGNIVFAGYLILLQGCSLQKVRQTPASDQYAEIEGNFYDNGFPKQKQPWVVFSDRSNNKINPTIKEESDVIYKEASFLAPFVILKKKNGMFKIAEYKPDLINNGKLPKTKGLKVAGWISEERLLLWSNSLKNSKTGFASKAAIVVNHQDVIEQAEKHIDNDSAIVFTSPDLINKTGKKISLGSIVYIYKQSENKGCVLIGKQQSIITDSIQNNIYGWVSRKMMSLWGERSSVRVASDSLAIRLEPTKKDTLFEQYAISPKELKQRTGMESIYPINSSDSLFNQIKFFTNVFDYDKNKIYNVLGNPIFYRRYREILSDNKKLNVIFVLDVSKNNRLYTPVAKSLLQELQLNFINPTYFSSIKFGGVVYKQNSCGVNPLHSSLSGNYRDITLFFEDKINRLYCSDTTIVQPVDRGLLSAAKMLAGSQNQTNLIILIGATADQSTQSQTAINALTRANAKLIFFQTQSKSADTYNDFVLLGQKSVVNSAKNIAERKKEKIVNQNDLLINNNYSLTTGENGVYYLDYPKQSMTQGFVIFPKKGETMQAGILKSAIDTLLVQVTNDNKRIDSTLTKYFRSEIGVNNTRLAKVYSNLFPMSDKLIPTYIASSLLNQNTSFLINGILTGKQGSLLPITKHGILLNELEYEQLRSFYTNVYKRVLSKDKFRKRKGLRTYLKMVSESTLTLKKIKRKKLKKMPMSELIKITTGFQLTGNSLMDMTPKQWIKNDKIVSGAVLQYFEKFRDIAAKLGVSKGEKAIRVEHAGQVFYWLSDEYIPILKQVEQ
jgi:hypothetical protein